MAPRLAACPCRVGEIVAAGRATAHRANAIMAKRDLRGEAGGRALIETQAVRYRLSGQPTQGRQTRGVIRAAPLLSIPKTHAERVARDHW